MNTETEGVGSTNRLGRYLRLCEYMYM